MAPSDAGSVAPLPRPSQRQELDGPARLRARGMKRPCSVQNKRQKAHRPESYNGIRGDVECRAAGGQSAQKVPQTLRGYANERLEAQAEHRVDAVVVRHLNGEDLNAQRQKAVNHVQKRGRNDKRSPIGERKRPESHHDQGKRQPEHTVDGVAHRPKPPQQHKGDGGEQPRERGTVVDKRHRRRAMERNRTIPPRKAKAPQYSTLRQKLPSPWI